jgi:uncharacterized membrane protein YbhN (UPF0104 family)
MKTLLLTLGCAVRNGFLGLEEKPVAVILVAAGATVATVFTLGSYAGWPRVLRLVYAPHSLVWIFVSLLCELVAYLGYVLTIRDMARVNDGPKMNLGASLKVVVAGFCIFAATRPTGRFAVDYWAFRRAGAGKHDAVARVLALGILEYVVLGTAALVASALMYLRLDGYRSAGVTLPSLMIVPCFAAGLWVTSPKRHARLSRAKHGSGRLKKGLAHAAAGAGNVRSLIANPRAHGLGLIGSGLYWTGDFICLWAALQLVGGEHIALAALVLAYAAGYVLTRRSLPAGGAGVVEVALTFALVGMGVRFVPALVGVLVYRLFNFWLPIVPALILLPTIRDLRTRFQAAEREQTTSTP